MRITLSLSEREQILRTKPSERTRGGFQNFMIKLQRQMDEQGQLDLSQKDVEMIGRYAAYDQGGFEGRLRAAFGRHLPQLFPGLTQSLFP